MNSVLADTLNRIERNKREAEQKSTFLYLCMEEISIFDNTDAVLQITSINGFEAEIQYNIKWTNLGMEEMIDHIIDIAEKLEFAPILWMNSYNNTFKPDVYMASFKPFKIRDYTVHLTALLGEGSVEGYELKEEEEYVPGEVKKKYKAVCTT